VLGARVLGEFGDDPERYDSAKSRRNYVGTSPVEAATVTLTPEIVINRAITRSSIASTAISATTSFNSSLWSPTDVVEPSPFGGNYSAAWS